MRGTISSKNPQKNVKYLYLYNNHLTTLATTLFSGLGSLEGLLLGGGAHAPTPKTLAASSSSSATRWSTFFPTSILTRHAFSNTSSPGLHACRSPGYIRTGLGVWKRGRKEGRKAGGGQRVNRRRLVTGNGHMTHSYIHTFTVQSHAHSPHSHSRCTQSQSQHPHTVSPHA